MATRLLLTLLALLASLAAQLNPAQARVRVGAESAIGASLAPVRSEQPAAMPALAGVPSLTAPRRHADRIVPAWDNQAHLVPVVLIGIDRARE